MNQPRQWCPAEWLDEVNPKLESDQSDFLDRDPDGSWHLREQCKPRNNDGFYDTPIEAGQILAFSYLDNFGTFRLTVDDEGGGTLDATYPPHATHFVLDGNTDTLAASLDEMVSAARENEGLDAGIHDVDIYYWSVAIPHRMDVAGDTARLVPCGWAQ